MLKMIRSPVFKWKQIWPRHLVIYHFFSLHNPIHSKKIDGRFIFSIKYMSVYHKEEDVGGWIILSFLFGVYILFIYFSQFVFVVYSRYICVLYIQLIMKNINFCKLWLDFLGKSMFANRNLGIHISNSQTLLGEIMSTL